MSQEALKKYTPKQKLRVVGNYYTVYEAIQVGLDRSVELRVLNYKADPGTPEYQRFALECKTLAKLDHPHILKVLDIGMAMDHIFYVTDYREAKSLQELMDAGVEWSAREVIEHARSLASALKHIHRHQVLHRDLSLHSIKIADETGAAYISEFSLVKNLNLVNLTLAGVERLVQLQWTPEDIQGQPPTPRTDIFLLGWVLYRMLTYRKPAAQRLTDPSANDVAEEMFHPRTADPTIPEELDAIVRRCLQADPDQRYPDAPSLTKDLDAAQDKLTMKRVLAQMAEVSAAKPPSGAVAKPGAPRAAEPALRATRRFEVVLDATAQQTAPEAAAPAASTSASAASISASSLSGATPAPAATAAATPGFSTSTSSSSPIAIDRTTRQTARTTRLSTALEVPKRDRSLTVMVGGTALIIAGLAGATFMRATAAPVVTIESPTDGSKPVRKVFIPAEVDDKVLELVAKMKIKGTDVSDFFDRWDVLDDWVVQLAFQKRPLPFTRAGLGELRSAYYTDPKGSFDRLDALLRKVDDYYVDHPLKKKAAK